MIDVGSIILYLQFPNNKQLISLFVFSYLFIFYN